ncbi:hypothetical protein KM043_014047 [Ampulex compressa]|nr:hypothetical protein KM043_014047 [Ampulex compressa]
MTDIDEHIRFRETLEESSYLRESCSMPNETSRSSILTDFGCDILPWKVPFNAKRNFQRGPSRLIQSTLYRAIFASPSKATLKAKSSFYAQEHRSAHTENTSLHFVPTRGSCIRSSRRPMGLGSNEMDAYDG